ncbi:MAG: hypothetical protein ACJ75E_07630 [Actinomycetes bacterium]
MPRLTQFLLRHKLAVVAAWLAVLVAGGAAAGAVPSRLSQEFSFPGQEGYEANVAILETYGNGGPGNPLVPVITLPPAPRSTGRGSPARSSGPSTGSPPTRGCGSWPGRPPPTTGGW